MLNSGRRPVELCACALEWLCDWWKVRVEIAGVVLIGDGHGRTAPGAFRCRRRSVLKCRVPEQGSPLAPPRAIALVTGAVSDVDMVAELPIAGFR